MAVWPKTPAGVGDFMVTNNTNKKSKDQIRAIVFIFLAFFIYGISVGEMNFGEDKIAMTESNAGSRVPASVD